MVNDSIIYLLINNSLISAFSLNTLSFYNNCTIDINKYSFFVGKYADFKIFLDNIYYYNDYLYLITSVDIYKISYDLSEITCLNF